MTAEHNNFRPDPKDPFALDPQPESFTLDMVEQYSSLPTGVVEITSEGFSPVTGEALSLLDEEPRVFVVRHKGAATLIELRGPAIDLDAAGQYLSLFGRHVRGAHIRDYGRIGAAIINACVAMQLDLQHGAGEYHGEENPITRAKPAGRCDFERGIQRIEVELAPINPDHLIRTDLEMQHWKSWLAIKATAPTMVRKGQIPGGVSFLGEQAYEIDPRRKHRLVPGNNRPMFTSRNQIVVVTAPNGTTCAMCLDMLGAMKGPSELERSTVIAWLRSRVPAQRLEKQDIQCTLYAEIAQRVVAHHRNGEPLGLPSVITDSGRTYPMLLDYRVIEAEFSADEIVNGMTF